MKPQLLFERNWFEKFIEPRDVDKRQNDKTDAEEDQKCDVSFLCVKLLWPLRDGIVSKSDPQISSEKNTNQRHQYEVFDPVFD